MPNKYDWLENLFKRDDAFYTGIRNMPKLSSLKMGEKLHVLMVGPPGSGKTTAIGSFPGKIYVADVDDRVEPLLKMFPNRLDDIEFDKFKAHDFAKLEARLNSLVNSCPFDLVAVDSLTTTGDCTINYSMDHRGDRPSSKRIGNILLPEIEDFGLEGRAIQQIIDLGRALPCHFVLTAHVLNIVTKKLDGTETIHRQLLTGGKKIAAKVPALFNECWYFNQDRGIGGLSDTVFTVHTTPTREFEFAKTALPIPEKIPFTMQPGGAGLFPKIFKAIEEDAKKVKLSI